MCHKSMHDIHHWRRVEMSIIGSFSCRDERNTNDKAIYHIKSMLFEFTRCIIVHLLQSSVCSCIIMRSHVSIGSMWPCRTIEPYKPRFRLMSNRSKLRWVPKSDDFCKNEIDMGTIFIVRLVYQPLNLIWRCLLMSKGLDESNPLTHGRKNDMSFLVVMVSAQ